jgi:hypothetical protein
MSSTKGMPPGPPGAPAAIGLTPMSLDLPPQTGSWQINSSSLSPWASDHSLQGLNW